MEDSIPKTGNGAVNNKQVADIEIEDSQSKSSKDILTQIRDVLGDEVACAFESKRLSYKY
jgi:hypothetical protein